MKHFSLIVFLFLFSCGNKEDILLPKSDKTIVSDVLDHSPIYIFFRSKDKDTLAEVNRKNSIITTNWILNIDKRLPLKLVIPEVIKLQEKKRKEKTHKNEKAENYYSYADSIGKNMAFLPFTNVYYKMEKPIGTILFFAKNNAILIDNVVVKRAEIQNYLDHLSADKLNQMLLAFDVNMSYEMYIQNKIFLKSLVLNNKQKEEFIF